VLCDVDIGHCCWCCVMLTSVIAAGVGVMLTSVIAAGAGVMLTSVIAAGAV